jgi:hypothetical protein
MQSCFLSYKGVKWIRLFHKTRVTSALRISARWAVRRKPTALSGRAVDQFGPLTVAEAADRLGVGDPAAGEHAIGPGGTDPRHDQKQLTHLRRLHAARRVGDQPDQLDPARGDFPLQPRPFDAHLVRLRQRAQPLLGRPSKARVGAAHNRHGADSTTAPDSGRGAEKTGAIGSGFKIPVRCTQRRARLLPHSRYALFRRSRACARVPDRAGLGNRLRAAEPSTPTAVPESAVFQAKPNIRHPQAVRDRRDDECPARSPGAVARTR